MTEKDVEEKEIVELASRLHETSKDFRSETDRKVSEWSEVIKRYNTAVETLHVQFSANVKNVVDKTSEIFSWFFTSFNKVNLWLYAVLAISSTTLGILDWAFLEPSPFQLLATVMIPAIGLLVLMRFSGKWIRDKIYKSSGEVAAAQQVIRESLGDFKGRTQRTNIDITTIKEQVGRLSGISEKIASAVPQYTQLVQKHHDEIDKKRRQEYVEKERAQRQRNFIRLLRGAVLDFGVPVDQRVMEYLGNFSSDSDEESDWIGDAVRELSTSTKVNSDVLKLLYFEYVKDTDEASKVWGVVKKVKADVEALAKLVVADESREFADPSKFGGYEAIIGLLQRLGTFKMTSFRSLYYELYVGLAQLKTSLIGNLTGFGLDIDESIRKNLKEFVPTSIEQKDWEIEVIQHLGELVGMNVKLLELLFYDMIAQKSQAEDAWKRIKKDKLKQEIISRLSTLMVDHQLSEIPIQYKLQRKILLKTVTEVIEELEYFNISGVKSKIFEIFGGLEAKKKSLLVSLSRFDILLEPNQADRFNKFVPKTAGLDELYVELTKLVNERKKISMKPGFVSLLYHYHMQDAELLQTFQDTKPNSLSLATLLLQNGVVKKEPDQDLAVEAQRLSTIIASSPNFDPTLFQSLYQTYAGLSVLSDKLIKFLKTEGLVREATLIFGNIVKIMQGSGLDSRLPQVKALCDYFLKNFGTLDVKGEGYDGLLLASTCYFLVSQGDFADGEACKQTASRPIAAKILYRNMQLRESESFGKGDATLASAAQYIISNPAADFKFIDDFTTGLKGEVLYRSTRQMFGAKVEDLKEQISYAHELQSTVDSMEESVRDFMNAELPEDFLLYAIDAQLIQAYMVSTKSGQPILGDIIVRMRKICSPDSSNLTYKGLLLFTDEKTSGGVYTRIGVVPSRLDFEEFSKLFDDVFKVAVQEHIRDNGLKPEEAESFSANVFRLFASPLAFKLITGTPKKAEEIDAVHPIRQIKEVIIKQMGFIDNLTLVASSKSEKDRTIIVKKIMTNLFDSKGNLLTMIKVRVAEIIAKHDKLKEIMQNRELFDRLLMMKFGCNSFSSLAHTVYKTTVSIGDRTKAIDQMSRYIDEIAQSQRVHLKPDELQRIGASIHGILDNIGKVLQY
jgi:hypothetical protein